LKTMKTAPRTGTLGGREGKGGGVIREREKTKVAKRGKRQLGE